jgi:hypothetical protein
MPPNQCEHYHGPPTTVIRPNLLWPYGLTKASAITGYSGEEMLGSLLVEAEVVLPEFKPAMQQVISNAMSGINTENFELPLYSRLGQRVELLLNATSRHSAGDAVVGVVMVGQVRMPTLQ